MQSILKKLNLFFLLTLVIPSNLIEGQENGFINGKLIDSKDKNPISFATILIKNKGKGLISNIDGGFKIPYEHYKNDTLTISSMGYSSKKIPLSSLNKNIINLISLAERVELLDEVLVVGTSKKKRRKSAKEIINLALNKIPLNYPFTPFSYIGYYRDYQKKEGKYLNLNEALMEVFDPGFGVSDLKETQTRIYQYKKNLDFLTDTIASIAYDYEDKRKIISNARIDNWGGNEYTLLRIHDAIRNYNIISYDFVDRLDLNFVKNHTFKLLPDTYINNIPLYTIEIFKVKETYKPTNNIFIKKNDFKTTGNFSVSGKIFISKNDFKIYKMQYAVYDKQKAMLYKKQLNSKPLSIKEKNLES